MPLIDLIFQAEKACKLYPEKNDKSSFDSLKIKINDPLVEIKKIQNEVSSLRVKKNVVEILYHVIRSYNLSKEEKNQSLVEVGKLEKELKDYMKKKSGGYLSFLSFQSFTRIFELHYSDFVNMAQSELCQQLNGINFAPEMVNMEYQDSLNNMKACLQKKETILEKSAELQAKKEEMSLARSADCSIARLLSDSKRLDLLTTNVVDNAIKEAQLELKEEKREIKTSQQPRLQLNTKKSEINQEELEKKLSELEKKFADLEKQQMNSKKYILVDVNEYKKMYSNGVYQSLVNYYMSDLKFESLYNQVKSFLLASKPYVSPEMTEKLLAEINKYYHLCSHFYRCKLFGDRTRLPNEDKDSIILQKSFDVLKQEIVNLRDITLRHGNFEVSAQISLYSTSRLKAEAAKKSGYLYLTPSNLSFFYRTQQADKRTLKINDFFEEMQQRFDPQENTAIERLCKEYGAFSRLNAEIIKEGAMQKVGHHTILSSVSSSFGLMRM